jgi:hypothetical protein
MGTSSNIGSKSSWILGMWITCSTSCDVGVAFDRYRDDAAVTSWMFERVFSYLRTELGSRAAMQTTARVSSMRALGPRFIAPAG